MTTRRDILKATVAGVAGTMVGVPGLRAGMPLPGPRSIMTRVIVDDRFSDSLAFAKVFQNQGVSTTAIHGDVGRLWYRDIRPILRQERAPIAGLTDRSTLFCLEELARDVGMRVSVRIDHLVDEKGYALHQYAGQLADRSSLLKSLGPHAGDPVYGGVSARLVEQLSARNSPNALAQKHTGPNSPPGKTALVSWVIS